MNNLKSPLIITALLALASAAQAGNLSGYLYTQNTYGVTSGASVSVSVYDAGGQAITGGSGNLTFSGTNNNFSASLSGLNVTIPAAGQYSFSYQITGYSRVWTPLRTFYYSGGYFSPATSFSSPNSFTVTMNAPIGDDTVFPTGIDVNGEDIYFGKNPGSNSIAAFLWSIDQGGSQLRNFGSLSNSSWTWEQWPNLTGTPTVRMSLDSAGLVVNGSPVLTNNSSPTFNGPATFNGITSFNYDTIVKGPLAVSMSSKLTGTITLGADAPSTDPNQLGTGQTTRTTLTAKAMSIAMHGYDNSFGYPVAIVNGYSLESGDYVDFGGGGGGYSNLPPATELSFYTGPRPAPGLIIPPPPGQTGYLRMRLDVAGNLGVGEGVLASGTLSQTVVGRFNTVADGVFVVGAGSGVVGSQVPNLERQNAMRVLEDGTVLIQERGDLSMGSFQAGPRPGP